MITNMYKILVDITARTLCQYAITGGWHRYIAGLVAVGSIQEEDFYSRDWNTAKGADIRAVKRPSHAKPKLKELKRRCWQRFLYWLLQTPASDVLSGCWAFGQQSGFTGKHHRNTYWKHFERKCTYLICFQVSVQKTHIVLFYDLRHKGDSWSQKS